MQLSQQQNLFNTEATKYTEERKIDFRPLCKCASVFTWAEALQFLCCDTGINARSSTKKCCSAFTRAEAPQSLCCDTGINARSSTKSAEATSTSKCPLFHQEC